MRDEARTGENRVRASVGAAMTSGLRVSPEEQQGVITLILNVCLGAGGKGNSGCSKEVSV